jgi:hypothetical protein
LEEPQGVAGRFAEADFAHVRSSQFLIIRSLAQFSALIVFTVRCVRPKLGSQRLTDLDSKVLAFRVVSPSPGNLLPVFGNMFPPFRD